MCGFLLVISSNHIQKWLSFEIAANSLWYASDLKIIFQDHCRLGLPLMAKINSPCMISYWSIISAICVAGINFEISHTTTTTNDWQRIERHINVSLLELSVYDESVQHIDHWLHLLDNHLDSTCDRLLYKQDTMAPMMLRKFWHFASAY